MFDAITNLISERFIYALSYALVHSLWQITLLTGIAFLIIKKLGNNGPTIKYNIAFSGLLLSLVAVVVTFAFYFLKYENGLPIISGVHQYSSDASPFLPLSGGIPSETSLSLAQWIEENQLRIMLSWFAGIVFFSLRISLGYIGILKIKNNLNYHVPGEIRSTFKILKNNLGIRSDLKIALSDQLSVPSVIGHFSPIIILPVAVINQLTTDEVKAILTHELGHVLRKDYIQNLLIIATESIFFYHPGIWSLSNILKSERENCCDDLVMYLNQDRLLYAKTLLKIQQLQTHKRTTNLAIGLTNRNSSFFKRIKRILMKSEPNQSFRDRSILAVILLVMIATVGSANLLSKSNNWTPEFIFHDEANNEHVINFDLPELLPLDTIPARPTVDIQMSNGEIKKLVVDGKVIDPKDYDKYTQYITPPPPPPAPPSPPSPPSAPAAPVAPANRVAPVPPVPPVPPAPPAPPSPPRVKWTDTERAEMRAKTEEMRAKAQEMKELVQDEGDKAKNSAQMQKLESEMDQLSVQFEKVMEKSMNKYGKDMEKWGEEYGEQMKKYYKDNKWAEKWEKWGQEYGEKMAKHYEDNDWAEKWEKNGHEWAKHSEEWAKNSEKWAKDFAYNFDMKFAPHLADLQANLSDIIDEDFISEIADLSVALADIHSAPHSNSFSYAYGGNNQKSWVRSMVKDLKSDGLFQPNGKNKFEMSNDELKINGKSQSEQLFKKYKDRVRSHDRTAFQGKTKIKLEVQGNDYENLSGYSLSIDIQD